MRKQKRICFRLTASRISGGVIVIISALNLAIVGMAFDLSFSTATPAMTSELNNAFATTTFLVPTSTEAGTVATISAPTDTSTLTPSATFTSTLTNTSTPTASFTPIVTFTEVPSATPCFVPYTWFTYIVQRGDTLSHIARITDSTVKELMQANCMVDTLIFTGQRLYVPRLPVYIMTPTVTSTLNSPTVFQNPSPCYNSVPLLKQVAFYIHFTTALYDPDGVASVSVYYRINNDAWTQILMTFDGAIYSGSGSLISAPSPNDIIRYYFSATDNLGSTTKSIEYSANMVACSTGIG